MTPTPATHATPCGDENRADVVAAIGCAAAAASEAASVDDGGDSPPPPANSNTLDEPTSTAHTALPTASAT